MDHFEAASQWGADRGSAVRAGGALKLDCFDAAGNGREPWQRETRCPYATPEAP